MQNDRCSKKNLKSALVASNDDHKTQSQNSDAPERNDIVRFGGMVNIPAKANNHILSCTKDEVTDEFVKTRQSILAVATLSRELKERACLDSGASVTMFKQRDQTEEGTYVYGSEDKIETACGKKRISCDGSGVFVQENLRIPDAIHVGSLNMTLVSVGQICDQGKVVIFTGKEAIILATKQVDVSPSLVQDIIPREANGLYMFKFFSNMKEFARKAT